MTEAEQHLWKSLRRRQLANCRFRRQHPVGPYVADFACLERMLIVEIDGGRHNNAVDGKRDKQLLRRGFRILRFWNNDVLGRTDDIVAEILRALELTHPLPDLPPRAGEGEERASRLPNQDVIICSGASAC